MKTYKYNISRPLTFLKSGVGKLKIKSVLIIFLFFIHQSLFAQNKNPENGLDAYSQFLIVILILLIASIFIALEIFDDPKYESQNQIHNNKSQVVADSFISPGYFFDKSITAKLKIAVYSAGLLVVVYAVLVFLMF